MKLPLLLCGDSTEVLREQIPQSEYPHRWMLRNPARVSQLLHQSAQAGADVVCAPTGGLNMLSLAESEEQQPQTRRLNEAMVELARQSCEGQSAIAGMITTAGHQTEPFGPLPYTDLVDCYAEQALELAAAGALLLVLRMHTFEDLRAAVLGARQACLPMVALLAIAEDKTPAADPLAALLCLQELGIWAFGVAHKEQDKLQPVLERLAPYARVALAAELQVGLSTPDEYMRQGFDLLAVGARIVVSSGDAAPVHIAALRQLLDGFDPDVFPLSPKKEPAPLLLSDGNRVYYLEEDYTTSEEIAPALDMSEEILSAEDEAVDALLFRVDTLDDAWNLGQNIHMAGTAVSLLAGSEEALEMALLYYGGRALVDARSDIAPETLCALAEGYGAVVR